MRLTTSFADSLARVGDAGPKWLVERRKEAATAFASLALPTESEEDFRYGRIDELDLEGFAPAGSSPEQPDSSRGKAISRRLLDALDRPVALVWDLDGAAPEVELPDGALPKGVSVTTLAESDVAPERFGSLLASVPEAFATLAEALTVGGFVVNVAPGVVLERPIVIVHAFAEDAPDRIATSRTLVRLAPSAQANVIELFVSGAVAHCCVPVTELDVAEGAHLAYQSIQQLGPEAWALSYQLSEVARDGVLQSFSAALGGEYARLYTRSDLVGTGAESRLNATYLATGSQVQDLRTFQEHRVGRTTSDLVFKGAVADRARSVYTGLIHIAKGAKRSNAAQTNRNIVLSEGADASSVPNLDIEEADVRCSHASAVGPIDADQRFYLEGRGVPPEVAERLILLGFFRDLFDHVPDKGCGTYLIDTFTEQIEAMRP